MGKKQYSDWELRELFEKRETALKSELFSRKKHAILYSPFNITASEYRAMAVLLFSDGAEPSVVADTLMMSRQAMTKVIDSLESKKLAVRVEHPTDRRRIFVKLLPTGTELIRKLLTIETEYSARVDQHFTEEELSVYRKLFWRRQEACDIELHRNLEQQDD